MAIASQIGSPLAQRIFPLPQTGRWKSLYRQLLNEPEVGHPLARDCLQQSLEQARMLPCDLPRDVNDLPAWSLRHTQRVTADYARYLQARRSGESRRFFAQRSHALHFIRAVSPTKLVDGAWLYGALPRWREQRIYPLVRTYLEELGDGVAAQNHVLLYRHLLASQDCDEPPVLDDELYRQGAIQLALGLSFDDYLPEVIGYNLGYEQLPLHLLISAFELNELDIDPYYFQLHVTIDNSASGHAAKAVQSVLDNLPLVGDAQAFYQRVMCGYRLNDLGTGSTALIEAFDLEQELLHMLELKSTVASQVHSDYCRIEGRTVNQWLASTGNMAGFLDALQRHGWIHRHQDPSRSRFWRLVEGQGATMFGVFNRYERQLLQDWIAGDWRAPVQKSPFRPRRQPQLPASPADTAHGELARERHELLAQLGAMDADRRESRLIELQAPTRHWSSAGLAATRTFAALIQRPH